jgi:hypothetical protein
MLTDEAFKVLVYFLGALGPLDAALLEGKLAITLINVKGFVIF